jgi:hypothetical protein
VTRFLQGANNGARCRSAQSAQTGARCCCGEPASCNDWSEPRNCQEAKTGKEAAGATKDRTCRSATAHVAVIVHPLVIMTVAMMLAVNAIGIAGNDAEIRVRYAERFELLHRCLRVRVVVKQACNGLGHGIILGKSGGQRTTLPL